MVKKYCIVPLCTNSTGKTPDKLFFYVPKKDELRKKWLKAMRRTAPLKVTSSVYCCEDHFDIEKDMLNYIQYKVMRQQNMPMVLHLKPGVVPHKFHCLQDVPDDGLLMKRLPKMESQKRIRHKTTKQDKHKEPGTDPPRDEGSDCELEIKMELAEEPELKDPLQSSPEPHCYGQGSRSSSPIDVKDEMECEEDATNQKVMDYETIISEIREEIAELKTENQRLNEENRRLADENRILTEKSQNITSGIEQLLQKSEHQMTNYEKTLSKSSAMKKLEDDYQKLKEENLRLSKNVYLLNSENKKQAASIQNLTEKNQRLLENIEQLKLKVKELIQEKQNIIRSEKTKALKLKIEELNKSNRELTEELQSLRMMNKSVIGHEAGSDSPNGKGDLLEEEIRSSTEQNQVLTEKVEELTEKKKVRRKRRRKY